MFRSKDYSFLIALVPLLLLVAGPAFATELRDSDIFDKPAPSAPLDTKEFLKQFHQNPKLILNSLPAKRDGEGRVFKAQSLFTEKDIRSRKFLIYRDEVRAQICKKSGVDCEPQGTNPKKNKSTLEPLSGATKKDQIEVFVTVMKVLRKPAEMEAMGLLHHTLQVSPWSESFWPVHKGMIGRRYADGGFPNSKNWQDNYNYITARPAWTVNPDNMAPSEKYDYLVGDRSYRLTNRMWGAGQRYINTWGFVPGWTGLCHGWAPASIMTANPLRSITLPAYNGGSVTFYPSDIKALASQLWGEAPPIMKFAGSRCKSFNPKEDEVGRVTNDACYDVNPGTFHMGIVNQLGVAKRSFVMDSTFDWEVWNYPLYAYQYHYFNPQTLAVSKNIKGSAVPLEHFTIDKFKRYRNPTTKSVVGVAMDVTYATPMNPTTKVSKKNRYHTVRYVYDLELDSSGSIVGGEWYSNFHPDFLWNPPPESRAMAAIEKKREIPFVWNGDAPVGSEIHEAAVQASTRGEPLAVVIERLVQLASFTDTPVVEEPGAELPAGEGPP